LAAILPFLHDMRVVAVGATEFSGDSPAVLTAEEYALFEQVGRPRLVAPGETLFRRGDLGTTMYVVVQGVIELVFGDDLVPRRLGRHGFFGELGLLIGDHARSADAIAVGSTVLLELRQEEFGADRKSTRLNSSHVKRSSAVFCL